MSLLHPLDGQHVKAVSLGDEAEGGGVEVEGVLSCAVVDTWFGEVRQFFVGRLLVDETTIEPLPVTAAGEPRFGPNGRIVAEVFVNAAGEPCTVDDPTLVSIEVVEELEDGSLLRTYGAVG